MKKTMNTTLLIAVSALGILSVPATAQARVNGLSIEGASSLMHVVATDAQGQKAQDFIDEMGNRAISFLGKTALSKSQQQEEFRKLLQASFDMSGIGRFALGRHWRTATAEQQSEYQTLFENMIVGVYSSRFGEYNGEKFSVDGSRADGKKDILVNSSIVPNGGSKIKVDWRVREKNGQMKIIDVVIEGVSMALTQRSDFSSVIQRGGGKIDVLLEHLRK